ncbi:MAG: leucine-rich repeat domain-containing protein [Promethearchaeota archaeon]
MDKFEKKFLKEMKNSIGELSERERQGIGGWPLAYRVESGNIVELTLQLKTITSVPESIGTLSSLQKLYLQSLKLTTLPESMANLSNLQKIDLYGNNFTTLPEWIGNLTSLHTLRLTRNKITKFPSTMGKLDNLKVLNLSFNQLREFPESLTNCKALEIIELKNNGLEKISESIGKLKSLKDLDLAENNLTSLPDSFCDLVSLIKLDLFDNKLVILPESIGNLKSIENIRLNSNKLKELPLSIGKLSGLQELKLGLNEISALPKSMEHLTSLKVLGLYGNNISIFPEVLTKIPHLEKLDLGHNQLKSLPEYIINLKDLSLNLNGNRWNPNWRGIELLKIQEVKARCRKLNGLSIFISHAWIDQEQHRIIDMCRYLENEVILNEANLDLNIINEVHICEEDVVEDIQKFMKENVPKSHLLLFIATKNSLASEACRFELYLADKNEIEILPLLGTDLSWEDLASIDLSMYGSDNIDISNPTKRFEFDGSNFEEVCSSIRNYITSNEDRLKKKRSIEELEEFDLHKYIFLNIINSKPFLNILENHLEEFEKLIIDLNNNLISTPEYMLKIATLFNTKLNN